MNKKAKITIGKTQFDFWFGLGFFSNLKDNHGIGIEDVHKGFEKNQTKLVPILMLEAAKYSAFRRKVSFKRTVNDLIDMIDDDGGILSPAYLEFIEAFTNSMAKDVPKEKEVPKKKELAKK